MKLNNKGFAITTIMYIILLFAVVVIALTLALLSSRKLILDKIKSEVADSINNTCVLVSGTPNTIGSKYKCEVKPGVVYNFFVLSYNDEDNNTIYDKSEAVTTNLIMDRNMCVDETPTDATKSDKCLVDWYEYRGNTNGPVTAMAYLNKATSTWSNLENLNITYDDEGENFENFSIIGKARLPRFDEVYGEDKCTMTVGSCPLWLINYLGESDFYPTLIEKVNISGIDGYWTLSSDSNDSNNAFCVDYQVLINSIDVDHSEYCGVRPVINVQL